MVSRRETLVSTPEADRLSPAQHRRGEHATEVPATHMLQERHFECERLFIAAAVAGSTEPAYLGDGNAKLKNGAISANNGDTIGKGISRGAEWCKFQLRSTFQ